MKKLVLMIIAMVAIKAADAQDTARYLPAFEPGQHWSEGRIFGGCAQTALCKLDSSSVTIDSMEYCHFTMGWRGYNEVYSNYWWFWENEEKYLRQTADHSKVYVRNAWYSHYVADTSCLEMLSYDMNLHVGDTFCKLPYDIWLVVDSVYYVDGRKHIRFDTPPVVFEPNRNYPKLTVPLEFVEGIGPTWGWLWVDEEDFLKDIPDMTSLMLGLWRDGTQMNGHYDDYSEYIIDVDWFEVGVLNDFGCRMGGIGQPGQESYTLYPNPVSETLTIAGLPGSRVRVEVYDVAGNLLLRKEASDADPGIDLSHLRRQMLLVRITTTDGCSTYKVMKL